MFLGSWGRFLVLVAGASLVIVAVLIVACFVGPGCWGFEYLQKRERKKKQKSLDKIQWPTSNTSKRKSGYNWFENNDFAVYEMGGSSGFEAKIFKLNETSSYQSKDRAFNFQCLPLLVAPNLYSASQSSTPKLEVKLFFTGLNETVGRLSVQILSASFLPCREYVATLDPFVTLEVLNNRWSFQKNERILHAVHTKVVRNSLNPTFNETFVFDVKQMEIKNWTLKFTISDEDRLTKTSTLFERRIHLKEVQDLTTKDHISFSLEMHEVTSNVGILYFGISYLPTAQRLNINIVKAAKLKYQNSVRSLIEFYPYVRVVMVNNHGKCIKKNKTCFRHKNDNPVFEHSLVFDLSISNLEQTVFLVLLCTKATCQSNSDDSSIEGDIETSLKENRDKVLGTVVLGRNVRCRRARDHWVAVMQNPRKMISVWHDLR